MIELIFHSKACSPLREPRLKTIFLFVSLLLFSAVGSNAQQRSEPKLDDKAVSTLLSQLEESLSVLIDDEPLVEQIVDRWQSHDDLAGKTRPQVLKILFTDVHSFINDKTALDAIWNSWTGEKPGEYDSLLALPSFSVLAASEPYDRSQVFI